MIKLNLKLMSAGVFVACAVGLIALSSAWATPGQGVFGTLLAGPVELDELDIKIDSDDHEVEIETKGDWECRVMHFTVTPGGLFGWHTHPGPVFVMVEAGTLTYYDSDDPDNGIDYEAGTGFVDQGGGHVHDARNEGPIDVEIVAFFLTPQGAPIRIDAPAP